MPVSPDLTNEGLFAAQKFVRDCLGSNGIDSTARMELGGGLALWSKLFSLPISIKAIAKADVILAVGLDSRFNFSVVGTKVRRALDGGAKLVTIDPRDSNLARYTDDWLRPAPGQEGLLLKFFAEYLRGKKSDSTLASQETSVDIRRLDRALEVLSSGKELTVIIGPQVFQYGMNQALVDGLMTLAERKNVNFIPLYFGANGRGALEMGVFPELGPGGLPGQGRGLGLADLVNGSKRPKVVYLVGDIPFFDRPDCDFLIVQDTYLPPFKVDAFLPASTFAEAGGSLVNMEGRVQEIVRIEDFPESAVAGFMRPDWRIFSDLAQALKCETINYPTAKDVLKDIRTAVPDFPARIHRKSRRMKAIDHLKMDPASNGRAAEGDFLLVAEPGGYRHRGIDISSKVGGLGELGLEEGFRMNPEDIDSLGLKNGDRLTLSLDNEKISATNAVKSDIECPKGVIYYTRPVVLGGLKHRREFWPLYHLKQNPIRVNAFRATEEKR
jgi:NADH dehydrogenase/NADH:ubiquinone oxidoreductase subunit G